jgi:hypothetical protein
VKSVRRKASSFVQPYIFDPTWEYDFHDIMGHRTSSGEVEVYVPPALRNEGPCTIIYPVAVDGSDLTVGVIGCKAARKVSRKLTDSLPSIPKQATPPKTYQSLAKLYDS